MRPAWRGRRIVTLLAGVVASLSPGCVVPPALLATGPVDLEASLRFFPEGTSIATVEIEPGSALRGVFVPSDPGAPVVLHLLESSASVASNHLPFDGLAGQLADLGFASLILDYRGVGVSSGSRSTDHIARDARAMWTEAVRRAGGDPGRVVLRATSLGGVALGEILESGARPAAVVWIAPVHPATVTERFADLVYGPVVGWMAGLVYRRVGRADLETTLAHAPGPVLVFAPEREQLLGPEEGPRLRDAVLAGGGRWVAVEGDHAQATLWGRTVSTTEIEALNVLFPDVPAAEARAQDLLARAPEAIRARFQDGTAERRHLVEVCARLRGHEPWLIAATALANEEPFDAARVVWAGLGRDLGGLPFEEIVEAISLADPAGRLSLDAILATIASTSIGAGRSSIRFRIEARGIAGFVRKIDDDAPPEECSMWIEMPGFRIEYQSDLKGVWRSLRERGLSLIDARRQIARTMLKAIKIPDRVRVTPTGAIQLQALEKGVWIDLDLGSADPAALHGSTDPAPG